MLKITKIAIACMMANTAFGLTVKVVDEDGQAIAGAEVTTRENAQLAVTNDQGIADLGVSSVDELHIGANNYAHAVQHLHGDHGEQLTVTLYSSAIEQIDVVGLPIHVSNIESAMPVSVLKGDELRLQQADTLGDTLKNQVGVHSSYYGPVAGSPVIRGLDGPRVKVTQNSLDVSDVSRVGADHVVSTETSTAEQIEILRGPATLFYGSGAIGGVVNVVDQRVPQNGEERVDFNLGHNTVADEDSASLALNAGSDRFAVYADGFWRDGDDYDIPGYAERDAEHHEEEEHEEGHDEHEEEHEEAVRGVLENSAAETKGFTLGGSLLFDSGFVGVSYSELDRLNGIPGHGHAEEEHEDEHHDEEGHEEGEEHEEEHHEDEQVVSDMLQRRWQLLSRFDVDLGLINNIDTKIAYTDYEHEERHIIAAGETEEEHEAHSDEDTTFTNETTQVRLNLGLNEVAGWHGALLLEWIDTDFAAIGGEAFAPPATTETFAVALLEEKHVGDVLWQLGARVEQVDITPSDNEIIEAELPALDFTPYSVSVGGVWDYRQGENIGASVSYSERAPSAAELYSLGAHLATSRFEIGAAYALEQEGDHWHVELGADPEVEASQNIDLTWRKYQGDVGIIANVFFNSVSNYYYQLETGFDSDELLLEEHDEHEGEEHHEEGEEGHEEGEEGHEDEHHEDEHGHVGSLAVTLQDQADAAFFGVELQVNWRLSERFEYQLWADSVRGRLDQAVQGSKNLPRMPAARLGNRVNYNHEGVRASLSATRYFKQDDVAAFETASESYVLVDASAEYDFEVNGGVLTTFIKLDNLTDEEARPHTSFIKDLAPLPGRSVRLGLRGSF